MRNGGILRECCLQSQIAQGQCGVPGSFGVQDARQAEFAPQSPATCRGCPRPQAVEPFWKRKQGAQGLVGSTLTAYGLPAHPEGWARTSDSRNFSHSKRALVIDQTASGRSSTEASSPRKLQRPCACACESGLRNCVQPRLCAQYSSLLRGEIIS